MGIKVGGIDIAESTINNELRIGIAEKILNSILSQLSPQNLIQLSQAEIDNFRDQTVDELTKKYPDAGLKLNE